MKRTDTTRQHLDFKVNEQDEILSHQILEVIDSDDTETKPLTGKKKRRQDDAHSAIVDYAISTGASAISKGASGVQYVMDTLSEVWKLWFMSVEIHVSLTV